MSDGARARLVGGVIVAVIGVALMLIPLVPYPCPWKWLCSRNEKGVGAMALNSVLTVETFTTAVWIVLATLSAIGLLVALVGLWRGRQ